MRAPLPFDRRRFFRLARQLTLASGLAALAFAAPAALRAEDAKPPADAPTAAPDAKAAAPDLMAAGPLPDIAVGAKDAPVTIVEYASMTCPHCAKFHTDVYPTLKSRYIDTGKVRFMLREFPLDPLAAAGFMVARCAGPEKRDAVVELLYRQQKTWAVPSDPAKALLTVLKQAGFTQESFDACLKDTKLYDAVLKTREIASETFKVESTPTFFINGKKEPGAIPLDQLDKVLEPYLNGTVRKLD